MRTLLFILLAYGCSHFERPLQTAPSWVDAIRSGEESLRVVHGRKIFYRRIAGGPNLTRQTSCELAVMKAQEDLRKEFQTLELPHLVEVMYFDPHHGDCAVTLSVDTHLRTLASVPAGDSQEGAELEASRILVERSERAIRFALTGLTLNEFEKFSQEKVVLNSGNGLCQSFFRTPDFSIHGLTHVCWINNNILGYCTSRTGQCWTRTPQ